ncbi:10133_t:CDS:2, partial [Paraglomus occultum]
EKTLQHDWETWLKEKKAISVGRSIHNTNVSIHTDFNSVVVENIANQVEANNVNAGEGIGSNESTKKGVSGDSDVAESENCAALSDSALLKARSEADVEIDEIRDEFAENIEGRQTSCRRKSWILSSGTNVGDVLTEYKKTIPDKENFLNPAYWNILDLTGDHSETKCLFSEDDWTEMTASFEQEVKLTESEVSEGVLYFFDELEKADDILMAIEQISPELIENTYDINLSIKAREDVATIRRAIISYTENLRFVDLPVSEASFDNAFTNMLTKRFLDPEELKIDVGEIACWASAERRNVGRSILLRARIGQKCDLRALMKKSINNFECLIGLRSGGLPEAHRKKIFEDRIDLAVTLRDIISRLFASNSKAQDDQLHKTFVVGMQSWGWVHEIYAMDCKATNIMRFGRLHRSRLPNTAITLPCLEEFFVVMSDLMATFKIMRKHVNNIALENSRAHRKRKNISGNKQTLEVGGCFGTTPTTPLKKTRERDVDG